MSNPKSILQTDFYKQGLFPLFFSLLFFLGNVSHAQQNKKKGLGNFNYPKSQEFKRIGPIIDNPRFLPSDIYIIKWYGINVMTMLNGHMIGVFSNDSGWKIGGFLVLDVSNPRDIKKVKMVYEPDGNHSQRTGNRVRTREFREAHSLGLSSGSLMAIQTIKGIEIWDFSNVKNPIQRSKVRIPNATDGDYNDVAWQLFWQAPYLYVAHSNRGISIVNTEDINKPYFVKTIAPSQLGGFRVGPIFALGNIMFISSMDNTAGFSILDISDPLNPSVIKTTQHVKHKYYASCWDGRKAVFTTRDSNNHGMPVYDTTTNPMRVINDSLVIHNQLYCSMQDNFVFVGTQDHIAKVDISNPKHYRVLNNDAHITRHNPDHGQVFPFGNLLWVGNDHGSGSGLIVHDKNKDTNPPAIVVTNPEDGAINQSLKTRIGVSFSDSILMKSVNSKTFRVVPLGKKDLHGKKQDLKGTYSVNLGFVHFSPSQLLKKQTTYQVIIDGIKDFAGNAISKQTFEFSTGDDVTRHEIEIKINSSPTELGQNTHFEADISSPTQSRISYRYEFGDGGIREYSFSKEASHTYKSAGYYPVMVTVSERTHKTTQSTQITVYNPLTPKQPTRSKTIIFDGTRVFNVNEDNDTVTAISGTTPYKKLWESKVGDRPRTLAKAPNGDIWVVNQGSDSITVLNPQTGTHVMTYELERGSRPYGIAFSPDDAYAYVTLEASGKLIQLNPRTAIVTGEVFVGDSARGIAIDSDSALAYITRFISPQTHAEVIAVDLQNMNIHKTIRLEKDITTKDSQNNSRGLPNYLNSITIAPDGKRAWIPSNKTNVDRGPFKENDPNKKLTFETTVRAIVSSIDLSNKTEVFTEQIDFDNRAQPKDIQFSPLGDYIMVAMEGQNSVEIRRIYDGTPATAILKTGLAPRGLAFDEKNKTLFVHNFTSRTVSIYDLGPFLNGTNGGVKQLANISTVENEALHPRILAGKQIFYNAADLRMSKQGYMSCASCHTGGDSDGRVWDFTDRGEGLRNTIALNGRGGMGNGNVHWTANFDEIQDFENDIRYGFGGSGFLKQPDFEITKDPLGIKKGGRSRDLDNLALFVESLTEFPKSPYRNNDGTLTPEALNGKKLFETKGCQSCHSGPFYTDNQRHDVGTIQPSSGQGQKKPLEGIGFDTPTLIGVWESPPYFHNGQAATLEDVLQTGSDHTVSDETERNQLVAYLKQIEHEKEASVDVTSADYQAGLWYGVVPGSLNRSNPNPKHRRTTNLSETETGIESNITKIYTGQIYDADGKISFTQHIVSNARLYIDGKLVLGSGPFPKWFKRSSISLKLTPGWHDFELRLSNRSNRKVPPFSKPGFGYDPDGGQNWIHPEDPGDMSLFRARVQQSTSLPGLYYGTANGNINTFTSNPQTKITTNLSETEDAIGEDTTEIYTGQIYDADGNISFTEHMDDKTRLYIDGELVLTSDNPKDRVSTRNLKLIPGWHDFELRISNGSHGTGPVNGLGFGFDPDGGQNWIHPEDPGDGSLFKTSRAPLPSLKVKLLVVTNQNDQRWDSEANVSFYAKKKQVASFITPSLRSIASGFAPKKPREIFYDLGHNYLVNELRYTPLRHSTADSGAIIKRYEVYVGLDTIKWTKKTEGTFDMGTTEHIVKWNP